ncbi:hypothetical protein LEN26_011758 [Aphanomyces euteiches]|nr:hypothetical protein AeMF1_019310 [Aphanomyces euteiches]KAH9119204.1 hypothetical protein LEN26_011758 [Aphanomyces euteiches]KAH9183042.1 hypothetical protein AeNC1_014982 [Aphanomyces euteiches]
MPSRSEKMQLEELMTHLERFVSVTKRLQSSEIDLGIVRNIFDGVDRKYPEMLEYWGSSARIIQSPEFESSIALLTENEKRQLTRLLLDEVEDVVERERSTFLPFVDEILYEESQKMREMSSNIYPDMRYIPPTSNIAELLFSVAGLIKSNRRMRLLPKNLDMLTILRWNMKFWGVEEVKEAENMK